eukprot:UN22841
MIKDFKEGQKLFYAEKEKIKQKKLEEKSKIQNLKSQIKQLETQNKNLRENSNNSSLERQKRSRQIQVDGGGMLSINGIYSYVKDYNSRPLYKIKMGVYYIGEENGI